MKSLSGKTVAASMARLVVMGATTLGVPHAKLLERTGLSTEVLNDRDARVPVETMVALWSVATEVTQDETFGLRLAEAVSPYQELVVNYIVRSSANLEEAIPRVLRYERLIQDDATSVIVRDDDRVTLIHPPRGSGQPMPRPTIEFMFANVVRLVREVTRQDIVPSEVTFSHSAPSDLLRHHRIFGANVKFDASQHAITLNADILSHPIASADPTLLSIVEEKANATLASLRDEEPFLGLLRAQIVKSFDDANLERISKKLGLSSRSLQRRLQGLGTSFAAAVESARREQASAYLADPRLSLGEISYLLGFSDQSAFHRAFVRWHKETPKQYRNRLQARG